MRDERTGTRMIDIREFIDCDNLSEEELKVLDENSEKMQERLFLLKEQGLKKEVKDNILKPFSEQDLNKLIELLGKEIGRLDQVYIRNSDARKHY